MKNNWVEINADKKHISREKSKARELRKSQWWKNEIAKGICHYCGKIFSPAELTMDHVVPISRGGKSTKGNIVPCCKNCNNQKKYLTPTDIILQKLKKNSPKIK
jgi:5-methylcytosine-specific restriction endonuclease McrA